MTNEERQLSRLQRDITRGNLALVERNRLMTEMFDRGVTQTRIATVLSEGSAAVGGPTVSEGAVHKSIMRHRNGANQ